MMAVIFTNAKVIFETFSLRTTISCQGKVIYNLNIMDTFCIILLVQFSGTFSYLIYSTTFFYNDMTYIKDN